MQPFQGRRTLVVGLGNPVLSDDGVGPHVVRHLHAELAEREDVTVELCCRGGLQLMEAMIGYDRAIVVDALRTDAPPGTVQCLGLGDLPTRNSASSHDVSLPVALDVGRAAGASLPASDDVLLVGVEVSDVETFGEACTPLVRAAIPRAAATVLDALTPTEERGP